MPASGFGGRGLPPLLPLLTIFALKEGIRYRRCEHRFVYIRNPRENMNIILATIETLSQATQPLLVHDKVSIVARILFIFSRGFLM